MNCIEANKEADSKQRTNPHRIGNAISKRTQGWVPAFFCALAFVMVPIWAQGPRVTLVDPNFGTPGDPETIKVYVQNVAAATDIAQVIFNTTQQPNIFVAGFNGLLGWQINTSVPVGATTGPVSVQMTSGQIAISTTDFLVFGPGPRPVVFFPSSGRVNETIVDISGDRFIPGTQVFFPRENGEILAEQVFNPDASVISVIVPNFAVSGPIRVASSQGSNFTHDEFEILQDIDLSVELASDPGIGAVNQTLDLIVTVRNNSPTPASGVLNQTSLDPSVIFVSASSTQGGTPTHSNGVVTGVLGDLAGESEAQITITVVPTAAGEITTSSLVVGNEEDPDEDNNNDTLMTSVVLLETDLEVSMTAEPAEVSQGDAMIYVIDAKNNGPSDGNNVKVVDVLPAEVGYISATATQGIVNRVGRVITADLGALPDQEEAQVRITVLVNSQDPFVNTATISGDEPDPDPTNDEASLETIPLVREADLQITKSIEPNPPVVGLESTYALTVVNNGPQVATDVRVVDTLPVDVFFRSTSSSQGTSSQAGQFVIADLGQLDVGREATVWITTLHKTAAPILNEAEVSATEPDTNPGNNRVTLTTQGLVEPHLLTFERTPAGEIVISWPTYPMTFRLQIAQNLIEPIRWQNVLGTPSDSGGTSRLIVTPILEESYYRLGLLGNP